MKNRHYGHIHQELLRTIAINGILIAILFPLIEATYISYKNYKEKETVEYRILIKESEQIAERLYGNKDGVLTKDERRMWYDSVGIDYNFPSTDQLKTFISLTKTLDEKFK
jgi:hypothetical protein